MRCKAKFTDTACVCVSTGQLVRYISDPVFVSKQSCSGNLGAVLKNAQQLPLLPVGDPLARVQQGYIGFRVQTGSGIHRVSFSPMELGLLDAQEIRSCLPPGAR
jgi:hypothetical protein